MKRAPRPEHLPTPQSLVGEQGRQVLESLRGYANDGLQVQELKEGTDILPDGTLTVHVDEPSFNTYWGNKVTFPFSYWEREVSTSEGHPRFRVACAPDTKNVVSYVTTADAIFISSDGQMATAFMITAIATDLRWVNQGLATKGLDDALMEMRLRQDDMHYHTAMAIGSLASSEKQEDRMVGSMQSRGFDRKSEQPALWYMHLQ